MALRDEDVWGRWGFAQELAQRAAFPRRYRMHAGIPALGPARMQAPGGEVDVVPAQCHQLRGPEAVAVSNQDSRGIPMPSAVLFGGLNEPLDLPVGEIFTAASTVTFTEVGAASRSRKFTTETALSPVRTVTDCVTGPDECSNPPPPDIAGGGSGVVLEVA